MCSGARRQGGLVRVRVYVRLCVCVCMCVCERERDRGVFFVYIGKNSTYIFLLEQKSTKSGNAQRDSLFVTTHVWKHKHTQFSSFPVCTLSGLSVLSWGEGNDFGLMMKSFRGKTLLEGKKEHFLLGDAHVSVNWELQCWEFRWCTLNEKTKTFCPCVCVCVLTFLLHGKNMPFFWPSGRDSLIKELSPYTHTHTHTEFSEFEDECFYLLWSLWGRMHFCPVIFKKWLFRVEIETFFLPRDKHTYNFLWAEKQNVCLFVCSFSR